MNLGKAIKKSRVEAGLSQEQLANLIFVSKQSISKYENNKAKPSPELLKKISEILKVELVLETDPKSKITQDLKIRIVIGILALAVLALGIWVILLNVKLNRYDVLFQNNTIDYYGIEVSYLDNEYDPEKNPSEILIRISFYNSNDYTIYLNSALFDFPDVTLQTEFLDLNGLDGHSQIALYPGISTIAGLRFHNDNYALEYFHDFRSDEELFLFFSGEVLAKLDLMYE
jgi:transcriptional regulator with XRE-family HTH domain